MHRSFFLFKTHTPGRNAAALLLYCGLSSVAYAQEGNTTATAAGFAIPAQNAGRTPTGVSTDNGNRPSVDTSQKPQKLEPVFADDYSEEMSRLGVTGIQVNEFPGGQITRLSGTNLGSVSKSQLALEKGRDSSDLAQAMRQNQTLLKVTSEAKFELIQVREGAVDDYIAFRQVINGIGMPESRIRADKEGNIVSMSTIVVAQELSIFNKSTWMSNEEIRDALKNHLNANEGGFDFEQVIEVGHRAAFHPKDDRLVIVFDFEYRLKTYRINAITGELLSSGNLVSGARRACHMKPGAPLFIANPPGYYS